MRSMMVSPLATKPAITKLAEAPSYGEAITEYAPSSRGAKVYDDLAKEVLKAHGKRLKK